MTGASTRPPQRRCRGRRPAPGELRPTDVVGAFFVLGLGFLAAAAIAALVDAADPWPWGRWLALHLAFVGGVSQLVLGASQFFAGAFLATDPPPRALVRAQLVAWNLGAALLAVAVPLSLARATELAAALLIAGLLLYAAGLDRLRRRSLNSAPWATRWYAAAAAFLAVGVVAGAMLARGVVWPHGDLLAAHMALNLGGWFGAAIVGTLHTFYPSLTRTALRHPRLQPWTFGAWIAGVGGLAAGYAWSADGVAVCGWLALSAAATMLGINLVASLRAAPPPIMLAARIVGLGQLFLVAGLAACTVATLAEGPEMALAGDSRAAVATLLVVGWIGLTVAGSLLHLLALLLRVRDLSRPLATPRPSVERPLAAAVAIAIAALAAAQLAGADGLRAAAALLVAAAYTGLGLRIAGLGARVIARARPSV